MNKKTILTFISLCACGLLMAKVNIGNDALEVRTTVKTPAFKWAKPYDRGEIKALIIAPRFGMREIVELAERMSIEFDTIGFCLYKKMSTDRVEGLSNKDFDACFNRLLKKNYDAIIIANVDWDVIPPKYHFPILKQFLVNRDCSKTMSSNQRYKVLVVVV